MLSACVTVSALLHSLLGSVYTIAQDKTGDNFLALIFDRSQKSDLFAQFNAKVARKNDCVRSGNIK